MFAADIERDEDDVERCPQLDGRTGVEITVASITNQQVLALFDQAERDVEPLAPHRR